MKISGSTILITGGSGGIGGAIARQLAQRGATLILVNRDRSKLAAFATKLRAAGGTVNPLAAISPPPASLPAWFERDSRRQAPSIS